MTQLGSSITCGLLTRLGSFQLPLVASMGHTLAEQSFSSHEGIKNCSMNGLGQKWKIFTGLVFINCPKDGEKMLNKQWSILGIKHFFIIFFRFKTMFGLYLSKQNSKVCN